jgi:DNA-binding LacI/PurR family transcriptional regulator
MRPLQRKSVAEQTAAHLREGLARGRWRERMPGIAPLAAELDVSRDSIQAALRLLEAEGLLQARGRGRSRAISRQGKAARCLRVGILLPYLPLQRESPQIAELLLQLERDLEAAGFDVHIAQLAQPELRQDLRRLVRIVAQNPADAWIVVAGSRPLLRWFAHRPVPCLALFGRTHGFPIARAGPDKAPAYVAVTRRLLSLGHRRIVLIARHARRKPIPGNVERAFLAELAARGIQTGSYNLPDWVETPAGLDALLGRLFSVTPPTALIVDETPLLLGVMNSLLHRGIRVPAQVSLVSTDYDASLEWCEPSIAHMRWESDPVIRHALRWVTAVRRGSVDRTIRSSPTEFVIGGSIGPAAPMR